MAKKKVVLFIVEGTTDEDFLGFVLENLIDKRIIHYEVYRGDITAEIDFQENNIKTRINGCVKNFLAREDYLQEKDIEKVVLVSDLDGCFIPAKPEWVRECPGEVQRNEYYSDCIKTVNREEQIGTMHRKSRNLRIASTMKKVGGKFQFSAFYLSCNREDAFGYSKNHSNEEKEDITDYLYDRYYGNSLLFIRDLFNLLEKVVGSENLLLSEDDLYALSWKAVQEKNKSLLPGSNLFCFLQKNQNSLTDEAQNEVRRVIEEKAAQIGSSFKES